MLNTNLVVVFVLKPHTRQEGNTKEKQNDIQGFIGEFRLKCTVFFLSVSVCFVNKMLFFKAFVGRITI